MERPRHHAQITSGVAQSVADRGQGPGMIVVHTAAPTAVERNVFARFLTDDLQPWVETEYRVAPFVVLVGDPESVARAPENFATIAINADLSMKASFGGDRRSAPPAAEAHVALRDGFQWLFDGWELADIAELASQPGDAGWAEIDAHYAALSERYGYSAVPHEDIADVAGRVRAQQGRWDHAERELLRNADLHPGSARVFNHLGDLYRMLCRAEESRENYSKAYDMASEMRYSAFTSRFSITVTLEEGRLWVLATGQDKIPVFAESEAKFYAKAAPVQFTFVKDDTGAVISVLMQQGGRELTGRKVNE